MPSINALSHRFYMHQINCVVLGLDMGACAVHTHVCVLVWVSEWICAVTFANDILSSWQSVTTIFWQSAKLCYSWHIYFHFKQFETEVLSAQTLSFPNRNSMLKSLNSIYIYTNTFIYIWVLGWKRADKNPLVLVFVGNELHTVYGVVCITIVELSICIQCHGH